MSIKKLKAVKKQRAVGKQEQFMDLSRRLLADLDAVKRLAKRDLETAKAKARLKSA